MKIKFYKSRWSELTLFPTIALDFTYKEITLVWLWFAVMFDWWGE